MDLIYRNTRGEDIGILKGFVFDLAFGSSENNFSFKMPLSRHCCEAGYMLYIENTEYGGIIDQIKADTNKQTVTYTGRTWHGILSGKIISPGIFDYYTASGTAEETIRTLINRAGLSDLFNVINSNYFYVQGYKFRRYVDLYIGIQEMLAAYGAKLLMRYNGATGKVDLSVVYLYDYSRDEEWDSDLFNFIVKKDFATPNHFVCLGSGELRNRYVIDLFTDEYGNVQDYYSLSCPRLSDGTYAPTNDSHYRRRDLTRQKLFGIQEVTEKYDYPNAGTIETFVALTRKPANWDKRYQDYYLLDETGQYVHVATENVHEVQLLESEPANWNKNFSMYVDADGNKVQGVVQETYAPVPKIKPDNWDREYSNYYVSNGIGGYSQVTAESEATYTRQTSKPSDWATNWSDYYELVDAYQIVDYPRPTYMAGRYYAKEGSNYRLLQSGKPVDWELPGPTEYYEVIKVYAKVSGSKAPTWTTNKYYTKGSRSIAPEWHSNWQYYIKKYYNTAPPWQPNTYYMVVDYSAAPAWVYNMYYELNLDHYADLIENALEHIKEVWQKDSIQTDLDPQKYEYDIGDIVGATEHMTGIFVYQPISKKIVTIKDNIISIKYEIGG